MRSVIEAGLTLILPELCWSCKEGGISNFNLVHRQHIIKWGYWDLEKQH